MHLAKRENKGDEDAYEGDEELVVGDFEDDDEDLQVGPPVYDEGVITVTTKGDDKVDALVIHRLDHL